MAMLSTNSKSLWGFVIVVLLCSPLALLPVTESAQILGLFSHPGKSHFHFFQPLLTALANRGHNLTVVSYFPNKTPVTNYTDYVLSGVPVLSDFIDIKVFSDSSELFPIKIDSFFMLHGWGMASCEAAFKSDVIRNILRSPIKYDVVILEQFNNDCMMAVAYLLDAPVIALSSCALMPWLYDRMGSPFIPSAMPMNFLPYTEEMSFIHRLNNFLHFHTANFLYEVVTQRQTNALIRQHFGDDIPPIQELVKNTSLMLINQHFSITGAVPRAPNVLDVGGLQLREPQPLAADLQKLIDASPHGVIYISWGSMIRPDSLPPAKRDVIMNSLSQFPEYTVLMRWPNETLPNKPPNVHTLSWMPQFDILCHPKVKAFMTHGGLLGVSEGAFCGVPMLVTPFYGDQFLNAAAVERRQLGVIVRYNEFTEQNIVKNLKRLLQPDFAQKAKIIAESFRNRPEDPLNQSVWWVEQTIRTKGLPLLRSYTIRMPWLAKHSIDVYLAVITIIIILTLIIGSALVKCLTIVMVKNKRKLKSQ